MLVIRLRRTGRKKQATYNLVVAEKSNAVKGKFLEMVGSYNSTVKPKELTFDEERIRYWISNGARPSDTVAALLKNAGLDGMEKYMELRNKKKKKKKEQPEEAAPAVVEKKKEEAPVKKAEEKVEEAPTEEVA